MYSIYNTNFTPVSYVQSFDQCPQQGGDVVNMVECTHHYHCLRWFWTHWALVMSHWCLWDLSMFCCIQESSNKDIRLDCGRRPGTSQTQTTWAPTLTRWLSPKKIWIVTYGKGIRLNAVIGRNPYRSSLSELLRLPCHVPFGWDPTKGAIWVYDLCVPTKRN